MELMEGKVVAITGASRGIGEAVALLLASRGARVVLGARDDTRLQSLADRIVAAGGQAIWVATDVTQPDDLKRLVKLALDRFGRLDVLINNAGIGPLAPLDELKVDEWNAMIDVNLKGVLWGIAAALPVFRRQGFGHFVTTTSTADRKTVPNMAVYSATKTAVRTLCEGLRQESGPHLRVSIVSPGFIDTGFVDTIADPVLRAKLTASRDEFAISPDAVAQAMAYIIDQPADVDVNEMVVRPTAQA